MRIILDKAREIRDRPSIVAALELIERSVVCALLRGGIGRARRRSVLMIPNISLHSATRLGINIFLLLAGVVALRLGESVIIPLIIALLLASVLGPAAMWLHHGAAVRERNPIRRVLLSRCDDLGRDHWYQMMTGGALYELDEVVLDTRDGGTVDWLRGWLPGTAVEVY